MMIEAITARDDLRRDYSEMINVGDVNNWVRNPVDRRLREYHQHGLGNPCPGLLR